MAKAMTKRETKLMANPSEASEADVLSLQEAREAGAALSKRLPNTDTSTHKGATNWFAAMLAKAASEGVFVIEEMLTPQLARILLDRNPDNRNVSNTRVRRLVGAILADTFNGMNGQLILISKEGDLNDGQHRCLAVMESGKGVMIRFMFGLDRESRMTIDQVGPRDAGDFLTMSGEEQGSEVAAVAQMLNEWQTDRAIRRRIPNRLPASEVAEFAKGYLEEIYRALRIIPTKGSIAIGGRRLLAFVHVILSRYDPEAATDYLTRIQHGHNLEEGSAVLAVRNRLSNDRRLTRSERLEVLLRGWNAYRDGRPMTSIPVHGRLPEIA